MDSSFLQFPSLSSYDLHLLEGEEVLTHKEVLIDSKENIEK